MAEPDTLADHADAARGVPAAGLDASLVELGRRIEAARAAAERRAAAPPPGPERPFPLRWLVAVVLLVVAVLAGGLALATTDGGDAATTAAGLDGASAGGAVDDGLGRGRAADEASAATGADAATGVDAVGAAADAVAGPAAATGSTGASRGGASAGAAVPDAAANAPNQTVREVTVAAGESFWSIAEREVSAQLGRAATDAEITPWWADLLAANADRLVEPGNPNLLLPGQVLVTPSGGG